VRPKSVEHAVQVAFGRVEEAVVVQRAAAAEVALRHPGGVVPSVEEPLDHRGGRLRLGREVPVFGDARGLAAAGIGGPRPWNVQFPVHRGVPTRAGIDEVDGDLGVLDPARGAGVLPLHANRARALLNVTGLVDDQHRRVVVQVLDHVVAEIVTDRVRVP
jgi:hypothetical protein